MFCIRDTERRLDKVLDGAMLEHEALPGFEDIRFEGEWRFVKALTARSKKDSFASLGSLSSLASHSPASRPSVMGLFASPDRATSMHFGNGTASTQGSPAGAPSPNKLVSARSRTPSTPMMRSGSGQITPMSAGKDTIELSPRSVTSILSSTLFILQHYDFAGHPCIVVQAFSQLLYWIASELFNRILTSAKKRHLCRSRAIQIRLNVSSLEDWARTNRLPVQMVSAHFKPLNELLQWLQCLSSESSIDSLLATMQNLKTLNPVQMRKAVKDYRYEVDEPKMSEECAQYLAQLHKDWECVIFGDFDFPAEPLLTVCKSFEDGGACYRISRTPSRKKRKLQLVHLYHLGRPAPHQNSRTPPLTRVTTENDLTSLRGHLIHAQMLNDTSTRSSEALYPVTASARRLCSLASRSMRPTNRQNGQSARMSSWIPESW